jgi:hypothetical protein
MPNGNGQQTCFVAMGFGEKTDYQSTPQRVLNLNRTFEDIIEPAVKDAGLECIRADRIIHSTVIDKPMYEQLLEADVVIADLSTSNANAIYELGVRHALRPHATIVIAETLFKFPFDLNHLMIDTYTHLGQEIGFREVMRMRDVLTNKIKTILNAPQTDSPVFLFLPQLLKSNVLPPGHQVAAPPVAAATAEPKDRASLGELFGKFDEAKKRAKRAPDWVEVLNVVTRIHALQPTDPYTVQQHALATYKSELPNPIESLLHARNILSALQPDTSSDAETVGLWGAIHKRLWDKTGDPEYLNRAIRSYARGYFIKDDFYNGINFAFLLNARAAATGGEEAIADRVLARRIRQEVLVLCDTAIAADAKAVAVAKAIEAESTAPVDEPLKPGPRFWLKATRVEALCGLGRQAESDALRAEIIVAPPEAWMPDSMDGQLAALRKLLES